MVEGKDRNLQHLPPHSLMASLLAQVRDLCNDQGVHEPDSAGCTFPDAFGVAGVLRMGMDQHDKEMEEEEECTDVVQPCLHYYLAAAKDSGAASAAAAEAPTIYSSEGMRKRDDEH
ncbi:unnamed protein product [Sphagnum troendelagicum]|uniref:Uncharacterized protein n=2 Tax=Sphagnum TaxID=13804 RepID=A0ABP0V3X6_9BRYO